MPSAKLMTLSEAIGRFVPDGASVAAGLCLEALIPFAAGHEIIRQGRRGLTLIGPISDMLFDQLIGAGCARHVRAAWVGNVITGSGYSFRRAVESGTVGIEDHSNLTLAMALKAGALGLPFLPLRTAMGSDLLRTNASLKVLASPFSGESLAAVAAIAPDVAILHVQRSDEQGNAHAWGPLGVARDAGLAARSVILTAEEIVPKEVIAGDPNRVVIPGFRVSAVVHAPWGGHPSPVPGHYNRDHQAFIDYRNASRTPDGFREWQREWVDGIGNAEGYRQRVGPQRLEALRLGRHAFAAAVDYGY